MSVEVAIKPDARVTRRDIACAAGVSVTAVSNALNDTPGTRLGGDTRERIRRVARELGYRNNFTGKALMSGKTYTIALVQPRVSSLSYRYYHPIVEGLVDEMEKEEYHLLLLFNSEDQRYMKPLKEGRVDGVLVLESLFGDEHIRAVEETGIPMVVVNRVYNPGSGGGCGNLHSDHADVTERMVGELAACGRRSLLWISDYVPKNEPGTLLAEGFMQAVARRVGEGVVGACLTAGGKDFPRQARSLLQSGQHYQGVIVNGADLSEMYLCAAAEAGLKIGEDYDLITTSCMRGEVSYSRRERATYTQNPRLMGKSAWQLLKRIIDRQDATRQVALKYERYSVRENPSPELVTYPL